jgi:hypothetical protein
VPCPTGRDVAARGLWKSEAEPDPDGAQPAAFLTPTDDAIIFAAAPVEGSYREELRRAKFGITGGVDTFENGRWTPRSSASLRAEPARTQGVVSSTSTSRRKGGPLRLGFRRSRPA